MSDSDTVIRVENLGKRYKLGLVHHDRLADALTAGLHWAGHGLRRLFSRNGHAAPTGPLDSADPRPSTLVPPPTHHASRVTDSDELWALRNVSFEVKRGEVLGIIGRNGSGKSTLLKILTGITEPTEGRAWLKGRVGSLLEVGSGFHPELTGRENIFLNGAILGMRKAEIDRKFDEIVDFSGIEKFIDTPVKRYSSGMYVRLGFAVAAHLEPEILLVDEVLAVGDVDFRRKCVGKMGEVAREGRTVLFVSHNMEAVENLCMRGVLLEAGRLRTDSSASDAISLYTAAAPNGGSCRDLSQASIQRSGTGEAIFRTVEIRSLVGQSISTVPAGEGIAIRMGIHAHSPIANAIVCVALFTSRGVRICGFNSHDLCNWSLNMRKGDSGVAELRIPVMNLSPGEYAVNILLRNKSGDNCDYVEQAATFQVAPADFFGTGRLPKGSSFILLRHAWRYESSMAYTQGCKTAEDGCQTASCLG